jgi:hypothetical protein
VRKVIVNAALSLLLLSTLVWGGCVSCEQFFMWPGAKGCCAPDGHCKTKKTPTEKRAATPCMQMAFEHRSPVSHTFALPAAELRIEPLADPRLAYVLAWDPAESAAYSPPDLQALHSTFLI